MRKTISFVAVVIYMVTSCSSAQPSSTPTDIPTRAATASPTPLSTASPVTPATPEVPTPRPEREIVDQNIRPFIFNGPYSGPDGKYDVDMKVRLITDITLKDKPGIHSIYLNQAPDDDVKDWENDLGENARESLLHRTALFFYEGYKLHNEGVTYDQFMKLWTEAKATGDFSQVQFTLKADDLGKPGYRPEDVLVTPGDLRIVFVNQNYFSENLTTGIGKPGNHSGHAHALHVNKDEELELWVGLSAATPAVNEGTTVAAFMNEAMFWATRWKQATQFSGTFANEFLNNTDLPEAELMFVWDGTIQDWHELSALDVK